MAWPSADIKKSHRNSIKLILPRIYKENERDNASKGTWRREHLFSQSSWLKGWSWIDRYPFKCGHKRRQRQMKLRRQLQRKRPKERRKQSVSWPASQPASHPPTIDTSWTLKSQDCLSMSQRRIFRDETNVNFRPKENKDRIKGEWLFNLNEITPLSH